MLRSAGARHPLGRELRRKLVEPGQQLLDRGRLDGAGGDAHRAGRRRRAQDHEPTLSGAAGTATGDSATIPVRIYAGSTATGTAAQTRTATASAGAWTVNATALAQGTYTAQAAQSDSASHTGLSAARTFTIDTTAPTATDISAFNAGAAGTTAGRLGVGDRIVFSYSEAIAPSSVLAGFSGASTAVQARFVDVTTAGLDQFSVLSAAGTHTVTLESGTTTAGGVRTFGNYVSATVTFAATMVRSADGKQITVTLGGTAPSGIQATAVTAKTMTWGIPVGVTDLATNPIAAVATFSEPGLADVDF